MDSSFKTQEKINNSLIKIYQNYFFLDHTYQKTEKKIINDAMFSKYFLLYTLVKKNNNM